MNKAAGRDRLRPALPNMFRDTDETAMLPIILRDFVNG
jgi:hypothetical protein